MNTEAIDRAITAQMKISGAPGVSLAVVQGDEVYVKGYGVREKGEDDPITPDTLFANASTTKAVTAATVAILVDEKKMAWDDPVRKHLPTFHLSDPLADSAVTIRDLLCHRTGLPRHDSLWYHTEWDRAEILRRIALAKPSESFRAKYQYQNICFAAAGEAVRAASGAESWEAFARERLLTPLGMTRTGFFLNEARRDLDHATPHQRIKNKVTPTEWLNFENIGPAGTMHSSANEMVRWLRLQLAGGALPDGKRLLSEETIREMRSAQMVVPLDDETREHYPWMNLSSYGLGWRLWNYRNGLGVASHGGAIDGFRAQVALLPEKQIGVALFVNLGMPFAEFARNAVFDLLLGLEPLDWNGALKKELKKSADEEKDEEKKRRTERKDGKPCPAAPSDCTGTYHEPAYGDVAVARDGKKGLTLTWGPWTRTLRHQTFAKFLAEPSKGEQPGAASPQDVSFTLDETGKVTGLRLFSADFRKNPT